MGFHQTKTPLPSKETVIEVKRQPAEWRTVFLDHICVKCLYIQNSYDLMTKKKKNPNFKMGRRSEQTFFQRRHTEGQQIHVRNARHL